jgi:hypothetical protein
MVAYVKQDVETELTKIKNNFLYYKVQVNYETNIKNLFATAKILVKTIAWIFTLIVKKQYTCNNVSVPQRTEPKIHIYSKNQTIAK